MRAIAALMFLLSACATTSAVDPATPGIDGVVVIGPSCPVEIAGSPCPDRPHETDLTIVNAESGTPVATVRSDAEGRFSLDLEPGLYRIVPPPAKGPGSAQEVDVTVEAGRRTPVTVRFDSGIR